jgi:hypothetical protein
MRGLLQRAFEAAHLGAWQESTGFGASRALADMASFSPSSLQTDELLPRTETTASAITTGRRDSKVGCDCARRTSSCGVQLPLCQKAIDSRCRSWMVSSLRRLRSYRSSDTKIGCAGQVWELLHVVAAMCVGIYFALGCINVNLYNILFPSSQV